MKKKKIALIVTSLISLSLSSCSIFDDFFDLSAMSNSSYVPTNIPEAGTLEANKATYSYKHFIEHNVYPISATPCSGNPKLLIIPVWFKDSGTFINADKKDVVRSDIETAYFGTNEETGWRSVKSFYAEESFGALNLTGTVSEWYEVNASYSTYARDDDTVPKTISLVKSATNWYFEKHDDAKTNYDANRDGYLDGVMLIYAAPDYSASKIDSYQNLWAYCFWTQEYQNQDKANPAVNAFFWASYDFMYGENVARNRTGTSTYASGDTSHCKLDAHTYIHEMGHMLGLEDYYDYSSKAYDPAGAFSMQDFNVGGHDAFSIYALGWGKAYVPADSTTIDLKPMATSGEMILLSPSFNQYNSPFDEYLLLEYYTPTGLNKFDTDHQYCGYYPTGTKTSGIRLWHVDARLVYSATGTFDSKRMTTNPNVTNGGVALAMKNTYYDGKNDSSGYLSVLGSGYYNFNLLQMIRNDKDATYYPSKDKDALSERTLFKPGETFTMENYGKQFVYRGKLNSNKDLGFSFFVNDCNSERASITINKL